MQNRIINNYEYYIQSELDDLFELSEYFETQYPNLNFFILYFSLNHKTIFLKKNKIIILNYVNEINYDNCIDKFNILLSENIIDNII